MSMYNLNGQVPTDQTYTYMVANMIPTNVTVCKDWTIDDPDFVAKIASAADPYGQFFLNKKYIFVLAHGWGGQMTGPGNVISGFYQYIIEGMNYGLTTQTQIGGVVPTLAETAFVCVTWPSSNVNVSLNDAYENQYNASDPTYIMRDNMGYAIPFNYYDMRSRAEDIGASGGAQLLSALKGTPMYVDPLYANANNVPVLSVVGHSFGTILAAQSVQSYGAVNGGNVDAVVLLQAAMPALAFVSYPFYDYSIDIHLEGAYTQTPLYVKKAFVATHSTEDYELNADYPHMNEEYTIALNGGSSAFTPRVCGYEPPQLTATTETTATLAVSPGGGVRRFLEVFHEIKLFNKHETALNTMKNSRTGYTKANMPKNNKQRFEFKNKNAYKSRKLFEVTPYVQYAYDLSLAYQSLGAIGAIQIGVAVGTGAMVYNQFSPPVGTGYLYNFNRMQLEGGWPYIYSIDASAIIDGHSDIYRAETTSIIWQAATAVPWVPDPKLT